MNENIVMKPITIIREEFTNALAAMINESGLPAFVISEILSNTLNAVREAEMRQLASDKKYYEQALKEQEEKEKNGDSDKE
mgnify:CR=1 FL=1